MPPSPFLTGFPEEVMHAGSQNNRFPVWDRHPRQSAVDHKRKEVPLEQRNGVRAKKWCQSTFSTYIRIKCALTPFSAFLAFHNEDNET